MRALPLLFVFCLFAFGCESGTPPPTAPTTKETPIVEEPPVDTKSVVYDQLHSGLFQADAAVKKIRDALDVAQEVEPKVTPDLIEAIKDMIGTLDDIGASLADSAGDELPSEAQVKAEEPRYKAKRDRLVIMIGDALKDIREQMGVAADLAVNGPEPTRKSFAKIDALLNQSIDDLLGSLEGLGAKEGG